MNVKALMLGLALAGVSTVGAHATVIFTAPNFNLPPALGNFRGPIGGGIQQPPISAPLAAVPEPVTWALMLAGFGGIGATVRHARRKSAAATA